MSDLALTAVPEFITSDFTLARQYAQDRESLQTQDTAEPSGMNCYIWGKEPCVEIGYAGTYESLLFREDGWRSFLNRRGIPADYAAKIPNDLLEYNVNRLLQEEGRTKNFTEVFKKEEGLVTAVVTPKYTTVRHSEIFDRLPEGHSVHTVDFYGGDMHLRTFSRLEVQPKVGDISKIGWALHHGTTGHRSMSFSAFALRLVCINGMERPITEFAGYRHAHVGNRDVLLGDLARNIKISAADVTRFAALYKASAELDGAGALRWTLPRLVEFVGKKNVDDFAAKLGSTEDGQQKAITLYEVVNAVTQLAHNYRQNRETAFGIEQLGGKILEHDSSRR